MQKSSAPMTLEQMTKLYPGYQWSYDNGIWSARIPTNWVAVAKVVGAFAVATGGVIVGYKLANRAMDLGYSVDGKLKIDSSGLIAGIKMTPGIKKT
jgi:hypothetical protein